MQSFSRAQAILAVFEVLNQASPEVELVKLENQIAFLEFHSGEYSKMYTEELHISLQEKVDMRISGVSLYFIS